MEVLLDSIDKLVGRVRGRQYVLSISLSTVLGALSGSAIAVGAMSLAAMIPKVLSQLTAPPSSGYTVLGDPFAWLFVYGAAAVGWAIHSFLPPLFQMVSDMRAEWMRRDLMELQESLAKEWGPEVITKKK